MTNKLLNANFKSNDVKQENYGKKCIIHASIGIFSLTIGSFLCIAGVIEKPIPAEKVLTQKANHSYVQKINEKEKNANLLLGLGIFSSLLSIPSLTLSMQASVRNYLQNRSFNTLTR